MQRVVLKTLESQEGWKVSRKFICECFLGHLILDCMKKVQGVFYFGTSLTISARGMLLKKRLKFFGTNVFGCCSQLVSYYSSDDVI